MAKEAKKKAAARRNYDSSQLHTPQDAVSKVKSAAYASFDESVDAVFLLGIDPRQADQIVKF